jgi:hypothetical protein
MTDRPIINPKECLYLQTANSTDEEREMMSRSDSAKGAALLTLPRRTTRAPSRAEIERAIARGRALQGEAVQAAFGKLFRLLADSVSLRGLRAPASLHGRRHSCC